ncbi:MAG: zeta toxin family protein [Anaerolineae bacterium]|nr:zeta toxin family protein [Anaerolineae bacterium]
MTINSSQADICSKILDSIHRITQRTPQPILVALDGASGSGKSTLASMLEQRSDAVVVPSDDFFAANIPDWEWDTRSVPERARDVLGWQRLRKEALEPLLENKTAKWHPFDFTAGIRSDGTYGMSEKYVEKQPAPVIILEGAYSSNPILSDLIDFKILIDLPILERHQRLDKREEDKQFLQRWHILWDAVEEYYFSEIMSTSSFDLVITNTGFIENPNA